MGGRPSLALVGREGFDDGFPHLENGRGRLLPCLDPRLVVGVDSDEGSIEADGSLEKGDQSADRSGPDFPDTKSDRLAVLFIKGVTGPEKEAVQVVP